MCSNLQYVNVEEDGFIRKNQDKNCTISIPRGSSVTGTKHLPWRLNSRFTFPIIIFINHLQPSRTRKAEVRQLEKFNRGLHNIRLSKECTASAQHKSKVNVGVFWSQLSCHVFATGCIRVCKVRHGFIGALCLKPDTYSWPGFSDVYMWSVHVVWCRHTHVRAHTCTMLLCNNSHHIVVVSSNVD